MRKDGRTWDKNEPSRQAPYRHLYLRYKRDIEALEDSVKFISEQIKDLRERLKKLEAKI